MADSDKFKIPPLPYLNPEFLKSPEARVVRILSEYLEPAARLRRHRIRDTIVFFGSARSVTPEDAAIKLRATRESIEHAGELTTEHKIAISRAEYAVKLARYYKDAVELARRVTEWSKALTGNHNFIICSGGSGGMMEAANRGASIAHGKSIGLNIDLPFEQEINPYVSRELIFNFHYFFMRKFWFVYPAKALVIFPGGFGTMDELFEVLTLRQVNRMQPIPVILYNREFWDQVINFQFLADEGTIRDEHLSLIHYAETPEEAWRIIRGYYRLP